MVLCRCQHGRGINWTWRKGQNLGRSKGQQGHFRRGDDVSQGIKMETQKAYLCVGDIPVYLEVNYEYDKKDLGPEKYVGAILERLQARQTNVICCLIQKKGEFIEEPLCFTVQLLRYERKNATKKEASNKQNHQQNSLSSWSLDSTYPSGWNNALGLWQNPSGGHNYTRKGVIIWTSNPWHRNCQERLHRENIFILEVMRNEEMELRDKNTIFKRLTQQLLTTGII